MRILISLAIVLMAATLAVAPASARPLEQERASGLVGDQADGYLGIVGSATPALKQQVDALNIERRDVYSGIARQQNTSLEAVGAIFGEKLFQQTPSGEFFRDASGNWVRKP